MWPRPPQRGRMSRWYTPCHALLRHAWPPMLLLVGAVRQRSWQAKLRSFQTGWCCNLLHTNTCQYWKAHTHSYIYIQARSCKHINTCLCLWEPVRCESIKGLYSIWKRSAAYLLPNQNFRTESLVSTSETSLYVKLCLVSWCQVGSSLCSCCIVHILSSLWAGMDYSQGIWVSQNLTTEQGTSWGPGWGKPGSVRRPPETFWLQCERFRQLLFVLNVLLL